MAITREEFIKMKEESKKVLEKKIDQEDTFGECYEPFQYVFYFENKEDEDRYFNYLVLVDIVDEESSKYYREHWTHTDRVQYYDYVTEEKVIIEGTHMFFPSNTYHDLMTAVRAIMKIYDLSDEET